MTRRGLVCTVVIAHAACGDHDAAAPDAAPTCPVAFDATPPACVPFVREIDADILRPPISLGAGWGALTGEITYAGSGLPAPRYLYIADDGTVGAPALLPNADVARSLAWNGSELAYLATNDSGARLAFFAPDGTCVHDGPAYATAALDNGLVLFTGDGYDVTFLSGSAPYGTHRLHATSTGEWESDAMSGAAWRYIALSRLGEATVPLVWLFSPMSFPLFIDGHEFATTNRSDLVYASRLAANDEMALVAHAGTLYRYQLGAVTTVPLDLASTTAVAWTGSWWEIVGVAQDSSTFQEVRLAPDLSPISSRPLDLAGDVFVTGGPDRALITATTSSTGRPTIMQVCAE